MTMSSTQGIELQTIPSPHQRQATQIPLLWEETRAESWNSYSTKGHCEEPDLSFKASNDKAQSKVEYKNQLEDSVDGSTSYGRPQAGSLIELPEKDSTLFRESIKY